METESDITTWAWHREVFDVLREQNVLQLAYVPDAGFDGLLQICLADPGMS